MYKMFVLGCTLLIAGTAAGQFCNDFIPASTPDNRFTIDGNEVTDNTTGLIWQSCSLGLSGTSCTGILGNLTWTEALQAAEAERINTGKAWRLPNIKELRSIVEDKCYDPSINLTVFPNTVADTYHTASPAAVTEGRSWSVNFRVGNGIDGTSRISQDRVRLVRDGGG